MAKRTAKADNFVWTDEEVELLLQTTLNYKTTKAHQGVDWESCQAKYTDIWTEFLQQYPIPGGTSYPHEKDAISKSQITSKLKAIRIKYRQAVDTQRRSGHGRVITLYFDLCNEIWGGSPATTAIEAGVETSEVNETVDTSSESNASITSSDLPNTEESIVSPHTSAQKRRNLLQARLDGHKGERLQKKLRVDPVQTDLDIKKKIVDILEKAEKSNSNRLDTIAEAQIRISHSFDALVRHMTSQPQANRAPPDHYNTAQLMAPAHPYTPSPMGPAHSYTAQPMAPAHSYTPPPMGPAHSYTPAPMGPAHSYATQPMGPALPSSYRQFLLGEHSDEEET
nr:uncharacterized protein LOC129416479 [Misgurnus anguillicaudatus]XP_055049479.1 uncharacterized protein LOC129434889 [Misgurnus anguillicaudatus]